jgi:hypothetical protein
MTAIRSGHVGVAEANIVGYSLGGPIVRESEFGPEAALSNGFAASTNRGGWVIGYVKGGGAWTHEEFSATCNNGPQNAIIFAGGFPVFCTNPAGEQGTVVSAPPM